MNAAPEANLFSDVTDPDGHTLALWHRSGRRGKWNRVATGCSTQEILTHMDQAGSGGFTITPIDQEPRTDML